jgi:hypothetical protein
MVDCIRRSQLVAAINFNDPVEALHYEEHIGMPYPTHAIGNCESCHAKGMYDVPDQPASLPGILSPPPRTSPGTGTSALCRPT